MVDSRRKEKTFCDNIFTAAFLCPEYASFYPKILLKIAELFTPDRCQWYWGYVSEAGVLVQLSIQATEDPDTLKEIYTIQTRILMT